jgi:hypothetical protein
MWASLSRGVLHFLSSSRNVIQATKAYTIRWALYVTHVTQRERDHLENPGVDGRIILEVIWKKQFWRYVTDSRGLEEVSMAGTFKHGNESKPGNFLTINFSRILLRGVIKVIDCLEGRSQWPHGLRQVLSSAARTLESQIRILLGAWMCVRVFFCVCVVLCR